MSFEDNITYEISELERQVRILVSELDKKIVELNKSVSALNEKVDKLLDTYSQDK